MGGIKISSQSTRPIFPYLATFTIPPLHGKPRKLANFDKFKETMKQAGTFLIIRNLRKS